MHVRTVTSPPCGARGEACARSRRSCARARSAAELQPHGPSSASSVSARCRASRRAATRGLTNTSPRAAARTAAGSSRSATSLATNPSSACGEGTLSEDGVVLHRHHHDLRVGRFLLQPADRRDARSARHVEIEHEHMRLVAQHMPRHTRDVIRFGDHVQALLAVEKQSQRTAHQRVVLGQHNPDRSIRLHRMLRARTPRQL